VVDAWVRPSPLPNGTAAAYLVIRNGGPDGDSLIGASADFVEAAEMHESMHSGNMASMNKLDFVSIPAGGEVLFESGGYHIMLINQQQTLAAGDTVTLTLIFDHAGEMQIEAEVRNE
jgi:periplasmic copper chaperone A